MKCNKRVTVCASIKDQKIVTCDNGRCQLMQKLERCSKQWYLKAMVKKSDDGNMIKLVFRHESVVKALKLDVNNSATDANKLTREDVCSAFLSLPQCDIVFTKQTMIVNDIYKHVP